MNSLVFLSTAVALASSAHVDLQATYPFSTLLWDDGTNYYSLHWNFTRSTETIYFAVNVSTTGWVGFGLSPNGGMIGSDVVIGWVAGDGTAYFHVSNFVTISGLVMNQGQKVGAEVCRKIPFITVVR